MWNSRCASVILILLFVREGKLQNREGERCVDTNTNTVGVCRAPENCDVAMRDLMYNGINPTFCVQSFTNSLVCCRQEDSILHSASNFDPAWTTSEDLENRRQSQARVSERKCTEYSRGVTQTVDFLPLLPDPEAISISAARCNYARVELIVGGEDAELGEFPHMAAIGWNSVAGGLVFKCGGSLISERFVMTAGHCLRSARDLQIDDLDPKVVRLGDQNLNPNVNDGASPIEVAIKATHKHPDYAPPVRYNDIALLELASAVDFSTSVRPACLWNKHDFGTHTKAIATGWGVTRARSPTSSDTLQKVSLDLVDNEGCDRLLYEDRNRKWKNGMASTQLCAGELRGGKDTCQGDSGGPLQVAKKENQCIFYIMGVTSFGGKCAEPGKPAVYTRVSEYIDWIESVVWPNGA